MHLRVKLYKDMPSKPDHIDGLWPAEVRQVTDEAEVFGPEWIKMTLEEFEAYRLAHWKEHKQVDDCAAPSGFWAQSPVKAPWLSADKVALLLNLALFTAALVVSLNK